MAYQAGYRVVKEESVNVDAPGLASQGTAAANQAPAGTARPDPWDAIRSVAPIIATVAERPGFLSGSRKEAFEAIRGAVGVILREAQILSSQMNGMPISMGIESVSALFPSAWKQWPIASKEGLLSSTILQFDRKLGADVHAAVKDFVHVGDDLLLNPAHVAQRYVDMNKAFSAIAPGIQHDDKAGVTFFLSRLNESSVESVSNAWKVAEDVVNGGTEGASWPEIQMWKKAARGEPALRMLTYSMATQLALLGDVVIECEKASPEVSAVVFKVGPKAFIQHMAKVVQSDANLVEQLFADRDNPQLDRVSAAMQTAMRESGDLRVKGMRYIVDNLLQRAPLDKGPEAVSQFLCDDIVIANIQRAKTRVVEQKNLLFGSGLPVEDTRATSIAIMNRSAVLDGLAPLWIKAKDEDRARLAQSERGIQGLVDRLSNDITGVAMALTRHAETERGENDTPFQKVCERFLREVSRNGLPEMVRKLQIEEVAPAHREALVSAAHITLKFLRPDMVNHEKALTESMVEFAGKPEPVTSSAEIRPEMREAR